MAAISALEVAALDDKSLHTLVLAGFDVLDWSGGIDQLRLGFESAVYGR